MAHNAEQLITGFAKLYMIHGIEYLEYIQEDELNESLNFCCCLCNFSQRQLALFIVNIIVALFISKLCILTVPLEGYQMDGWIFIISVEVLYILLGAWAV